MRRPDRVTLRSAIASTALHAAVIVGAVLQLRLPWLQGEPPAAPPPEPSTAAALVLAPEAAPSAPPPAAPLPKLGADDLPAAPPIVPMPTGGPAGERSRGTAGERDRSAVALPSADMREGDPLAEIRSRRSNPALSRELAHLNASADHLDFLAKHRFRQSWRAFEARLRSATVIVGVVVDGHGRIVDARVESGTGVDELDAAIAAWLRSGIGVSAIAPGVWHRMRIELR